MGYKTCHMEHLVSDFYFRLPVGSFYNYHHLLYIEEDGNIWIGVPGIYHEKEEVAANNFGFPEFRRVTDADLELKEDERNSFEDFGYWCRQVERS